MSPGGEWHGSVTQELARLLGNHVVEHGLGRVYAAETGFRLEAGKLLAPDIAFVQANRIEKTMGFVTIAPDLVAETASPRDSFPALQRKALSWIRYGASLVWVLSCRRPAVSVYRSGQMAQTLGTGQELSGEDVVPGFRVAIRHLYEL